MKKSDAEKLIWTKWQLNELKQFPLFVLIAYALIVHTWAGQLLLELLMDQFDTFLRRHIGDLHDTISCQKLIIVKTAALWT